MLGIEQSITDHVNKVMISFNVTPQEVFVDNRIDN